MIEALLLLSLIHDWYDRSCCSDQDCAVITDMKRITVDSGGYYIDGVKAMRVLTSPDGRYHGCVGKYVGVVFCIYVPALA